MTNLDSIIIKPGKQPLFSTKQGTEFFPNDYKYLSADGCKLRSKNECFWHFFLSFLGIAHTYEPNLPKNVFRPDFGIGFNFLLESGGMAEFKGRNKGYTENLREKQKKANAQGFNIIEIYKNRQLLNSYEVNQSSVIELIMKYNPGSRDSHRGSLETFSKIDDSCSFFITEPVLFLSDKDRIYLDHIKTNLKK